MHTYSVLFIVHLLSPSHHSQIPALFPADLCPPDEDVLEQPEASRHAVLQDLSPEESVLLQLQLLSQLLLFVCLLEMFLLKKSASTGRDVCVCDTQYPTERDE